EIVSLEHCPACKVAILDRTQSTAESVRGRYQAIHLFRSSLVLRSSRSLSRKMTGSSIGIDSFFQFRSVGRQSLSFFATQPAFVQPVKKTTTTKDVCNSIR